MNVNCNFSRMIDNLPYSIKPKNYEGFKRRLIKCLKQELIPGNPQKTRYEWWLEYFQAKLAKVGFEVPLEMVSEHTIIFISLLHGYCTNGDDLEYEMRGPKEHFNEYLDIIFEPMNCLNRCA